MTGWSATANPNVVAALPAGNHRQLASHAGDGCGLDDINERGMSTNPYLARCIICQLNLVLFGLLTQHKTAEQFLHELVPPLLLGCATSRSEGTSVFRDQRAALRKPQGSSKQLHVHELNVVDPGAWFRNRNGIRQRRPLQILQYR